MKQRHMGLKTEKKNRDKRKNYWSSVTSKQKSEKWSKHS